MCWGPVVCNPQCVEKPPEDLLTSWAPRWWFWFSGWSWYGVWWVAFLLIVSSLVIQCSWLRKSPFEKDCCRQNSMPQAQALIWRKYWKIRLSRKSTQEVLKASMLLTLFIFLTGDSPSGWHNKVFFFFFCQFPDGFLVENELLWKNEV